MDQGWTCACCGARFDTLPLAYACDAPSYWDSIPEDERDARGSLSSDFCVADGHFFTRGLIELPIRRAEKSLIWAVWVSLSQASFARAQELFQSEILDDEPPRFGWLSNRLPGYPETLNLAADVRFRSGGLRPLIELQECKHPLAVEQREGIALERAREIAAAHHKSWSAP